MERLACLYKAGKRRVFLFGALLDTGPCVPTLDEVLAKRSCAPLSYKDLQVYLEDQNDSSHQLVGLWGAIAAHEELWLGYCRHNLEISSIPGSPKPNIPDEKKSKRSSFCPSQFIQDYYFRADLKDYGTAIVLIRDVRESASSIHFLYLMVGSPYDAEIPTPLRLRVSQALKDGHPCDPSIFYDLKQHIYRRLLTAHYSNFVQDKMQRNITKKTAYLHILVAVLLLVISFTIDISLILLNHEPKSIRFLVRIFGPNNLHLTQFAN